MLSYKFYILTPNGFKKQGECNYDTLIYTLTQYKDYDPDRDIIVIEHEEDTNTDSVFFCGKAENFMKGKVRKL